MISSSVATTGTGNGSDGTSMDSSAAPQGSRDAPDYRVLPEPIDLDETVASQEASAAPDPTGGRDADAEWLLRNAAG